LANGFTTRLLSLIVFVVGVASAQTAPTRKDIPAIAKAANGSIVSIVMFDKDGKPLGQGSGFVVSKDGLIVTNYHVIAEGVSAVAKLPDDAFYLIDGVLASDKVRDVAVLKAHGHNFRTLPLGNSDRIQVGEEVVAIGSPLSLESTVSNGIVSGIRAVKEEGGKYLQITAPISPGSSGGPLFNMAGEVVGITTMYLKGGENLNFAIPINDAKRLLLTNSSKLQSLPNEPDLAALPLQIAEESELWETLEWIKNSFPENYGKPRGRIDLYGNAESPIAMTSPGEGNIMIVTLWVINPSTASAGSRGSAVAETEDCFNLRDIDPNTVSFQKMPGGGYAFTARTTNDELKIDDRVHKQKVNSITFELNPDYGPRFTNAFKRTVILAGGKPSAETGGRQQ
jgi:hypothetical protein